MVVNAAMLECGQLWVRFDPTMSWFLAAVKHRVPGSLPCMA
jgi:hypothetical protein